MKKQTPIFNKNSSPLPQTLKGNSTTNTDQVQAMLKLFYIECLGYHINKIIMGANFAHNKAMISLTK